MKKGKSEKDLSAAGNDTSLANNCSGLTKKEIRQIKAYCFLPSVGNYAFAFIFINLLLEVILSGIRGVFFEAYDFSFEVFVATMVITDSLLLVFWIYCLVRVRFGMEMKRWKTIVHKLEAQWENPVDPATFSAVSHANLGRTISNAAGNGAGTLAGSAAMSDAMTAALSRKADRIADIAGIKKQNVWPAVLFMFLVVTSVTAAPFIPAFIYGKDIEAEKKAAASKAISSLEVAFSGEAYDVYTTFEGEYSGNGYSLYIYTGENEEARTGEFYFHINSSGIVTRASYAYYMDNSLSIPENLNTADRTIGQHVELLGSCGADIKEGLLAYDCLLDDFAEAVLADPDENCTIAVDFDGNGVITFSDCDENGFSVNNKYYAESGKIELTVY